MKVLWITSGRCDNFTESGHIQAEQTALRNELELLKTAQSASSSDEVTPKRPKKKTVSRVLTVSSLFLSRSVTAFMLPFLLGPY